MIVITGAAGFIASYTAAYFDKQGYGDLVLVDDFSKDYKKANYESKDALRIERDVFPEWLKKEAKNVQIVIHLGARTDTTEFDYSIHEKLNLEYSKTDPRKVSALNTAPLSPSL